jgi:fatty-acyl-CoA synthase
MTMMDVPLNAWLLFEHAPKHFGDTEVVSRLGPGRTHRYTYQDFARRTQRLMHALDRLGLGAGERVATLAWNTYRHLECYFGVPCSGRVLHTLNLRLSPAELGYVIADAEDRAILVDADLVPLLERVPAADRSRVRHLVVLGDEVPDSTLPDLVAYEDLIADERDHYPRKEIDERTPLGICYTSGTTGRPKGAVYTHRSAVLHSMAVGSAAGMAIGPQDCVLPVVPMFHANAWGMPHAAVAVGAKLVFMGGSLDPAALVDLLDQERVTVTAGVPTVWISVADELARRGARLPTLRHIVCGGSQPPRPLIERYRREFDLPIVQAWGMTETSPLASVAWPKHRMRDWDQERITDAARTQAGLPLTGVEVSIRDDEGREVPFDGRTMGELWVRGPWVVDGYWKGAGSEQFTEGWFKTGDIAIGSPDGYFVIADRSKDLIKSGGEWISSVDMEGDIMAMPEVVEAAVVAMPDPKWQERPLAFVVPRDGDEVTLEKVRAHLASRGWARWQLPDRVEIIDAVPKTSVGKFDKKVLRARLAGD